MADNIISESKTPQMIDYSRIKNLGFPSKIKQMKFYPQNSFNDLSLNEIVRFFINLPNGFWDPKSAYIKFTVDTADMPANGVLQVDNSAQSFIQEFTLNVNQVEVERIQEYDTLSAIINDINVTDDERMYRRNEGFGRKNAITQGLSLGSGINPRIRNNPLVLNENQKLRGGYMPIYNYDSQNAFVVADNFNSLPNQPLLLADNLSNALNPQLKRADEVLYSIIDDQSIPDKAKNVAAGFYEMDQSTAVGGLGFPDVMQNPFPNSTAAGCLENMFSKLTKDSFVSGQVQSGQSKTSQTFLVPFLSGILGHLMPAESYKYVPMKALKDLLIEFRLSPYALFSSGYSNDVDGGLGFQSFPLAGNSIIPRKYKIKNIELHVDIIFFDEQVEQNVEQQLQTDGILFHTHSYYLGPIYNLANNAATSGTFQVNLGFDSLKGLLIGYLSSDYLSKTFCRKQFRVSRNINSLQIRIGSDFYPPQPIKGQGGNEIQNTENNLEFILDTFCIFGCKKQQQDSIINSQNFAINGRYYDINKLTAMNLADLDRNFDTAGGMPLVHENRYVGRSVYGIALETLSNEQKLISGVNTIVNRPIEITIKNSAIVSGAEAIADSGAQMMIFCYYDMLVSFRNSGAEVFGRA